jgi:DNA invertase Pin-like site-specific DNA recombinase
MYIFNALPLLTDFPSRAHWEAAVWEILTDRLTSLNSGEEMRKALRFLLSTNEQRRVLYRSLAASRFASGIGPREISRELWLTRQTISAIKKSLLEKTYQSDRGRRHGKAPARKRV